MKHYPLPVLIWPALAVASCGADYDDAIRANAHDHVTLAGLADGDFDGVADSEDNCLGKANPNQRDSDSDGFGNSCDADFDQDGVVSGLDFFVLRAAFGAQSTDPNYVEAADLDGDGVIGGPDYLDFTSMFGQPPGPSGYGCADATIQVTLGDAPCPVPACAPAPGTDITLNASVTYQTMTGWEATAQAGQFMTSYPSFVNELVDEAVNELGINRLRLEVRSGSEHPDPNWKNFQDGVIDHPTYKALAELVVDDNYPDHPDPFVTNPAGFHWDEIDDTIEKVVLPMKAALQARGELLHLNVCYVNFSDSYHPANPEEYAEFVLAVYEHMNTTYGLVPDTWELTLEPNNGSGAFDQGRALGRMANATAARLLAAGYTPNFVGPSHSNAKDTTYVAPAMGWFDQMASIPGALDHLSEIAYHRYTNSNGLTAALELIGARAMQHGIKSSMLEKIGAGYEALHDDLTYANVSAWQQFTLAFPTTDNGAQYFTIVADQPMMGASTRFLRQYFKYIRMGAQRIDANSTRVDFDPVSFINTDGRYVVVVNADAGGSFTIGGLPAGTYGIKYTTHQEYDHDHPDQTVACGESLTTSIPRSGAITIYQR